MSPAGRDSGIDAKLTLTKPRRSIPVTLPCSVSTHFLQRHRRFPEALRKLDQVLEIAPDDVGAPALKGAIAQAQGDLPQASTLLTPLRPGADDANALETQAYQAILEGQPADTIPRLKEVLTTPNPTLGYLNGELRFWLGWAQDLAGHHAAAWTTWEQARQELETFLKEQPKIML